MVGAERENFEDSEPLDCRNGDFRVLTLPFLVRSFRCMALFLKYLPNLCSKFAQLFSFKSLGGGGSSPPRTPMFKSNKFQNQFATMQ